MVFVRDEDADLRCTLNFPLYPVGAGEKYILDGSFPARPGQVVTQSFLCGLGNPNLTRDREDFSESDDLRGLKEGKVTVRFRV